MEIITVYLMTTMEVRHGLKLLLQIALMAAFVIFFGIPSWNSYLEKQVLTVTSQKYPGKVVPPTITVLAFDSSNGAWTQSVPLTSSFEALKIVCGDADDIVPCIKQKSHSLDDALFAELGYNQNHSLMSQDLWTEDFTNPWYGRSYTLKFIEPRGNDWRTDDIKLHVNVSDKLTRWIFFHDPDFFLINFNALAMPINLQIIKPSTAGSLVYSIALTEHVELTTPQDPCREEPTYSFQGCIKESLSRKAGCRMHWDSDQARPVCTTLDQYKPFAVEYEILQDASMREIAIDMNMYSTSFGHGYIKGWLSLPLGTH
jgi:hypothetical protein